MSVSGDSRLDELCRLATTAAAQKGHELGAWAADEVSGGRARRATCKRCSRLVYVRIGEGMTGLAGAALTEPCEGRPG